MNEEVCKRAALHLYRTLSPAQRVHLALEDLYQIAAMRLLQQPEHPSDAYAYTACSNAIRDKIRELNARKRTAVHMPATTTASQEEIFSSRQRVRLFLRHASRELLRVLQEPLNAGDRNMRRRLTREVLRLREEFPVSVQDFRTAGFC